MRNEIATAQPNKTGGSASDVVEECGLRIAGLILDYEHEHEDEHEHEQISATLWTKEWNGGAGV